MKKSFAPGEIYFIKEIDPSSKSGRSKWVKIGLVANDRKSLERLGEHQTGNPRRLDLEPTELVKTELVSIVETQIHRKLSHLRVRGEWFELASESDLAAAISVANDLARDAAVAVKVFAKAQQLTNTTSTDKSIDETPETRALAVKYEISRLEKLRIKSLRQNITSKFAVAAQAGVAVDEVYKEKIVSYNPVFNPELLKGEDAALYWKYARVVDGTKWSHPFNVKAKPGDNENIDVMYPDYASEIKQIEHTISITTDPNAALELADAEAALLRWEGYWMWEHELAKAELQVATGTAKAITGVCTWVRESKAISKEVFDSTSFLLDLPEEYAKYVEKPAGYKRRKVTPTKK